MAYQAISLDQVKDYKNKINRDLIESVVTYDNSEFDKLHFNVITDIENADTQFQFMGKNGTAQVYDPDNLEDTQIGYIAPRKLEVTLAVSRKKDNIQNYREKEGFESIIGPDGSYVMPNSEWRLHKIMELYRGDILAPMFFGDKTLGKKNAFGLYDGVYTIINHLIQEGAISQQSGVIVPNDPFVAPAADGDLYNAFQAWMEGWDPKLKDAEHVVVYMPSTTRRLLISDYLRFYQGMQSKEAGTNSFRFIGYENVELVSSPFMGNPDGDAGARVIATVPGNIDFGFDIESDKAKIDIVQDTADTNNMIYQIQTAQGMRIRAFSSDCLAVTATGKNDPREGLGNGQYFKNTVTVTVNDPTMGKVTIDPDKNATTGYAKGTSVTLTPQANPSHKFVKWSDNATDNPRTIVTKGIPESYQAVFEKTE